MVLRVGFLSNQIDNRGTGNAMFDYAHYNEVILGNKSEIFSFENGKHDPLALTRYGERFGAIHSHDLIGQAKPDVLYHIKSGRNDGFHTPTGVRYAVHAVFDYEPHGDRYAMVSSWLAAERVPFVPHIVHLPETTENLRGFLKIPNEGFVFARYGGADTFDINWAWDAVRTILGLYDDVYFLFMNTETPSDERITNHPRVFWLEPTADPVQKRIFINTANAMIHARARGETFGIAVGEFAICGKPILTYSESGEKAHLQELGNFAFTYSDQRTLEDQMKSLIAKPALTWGYGQHTPELVMKKFNEVFLS